MSLKGIDVSHWQGSIDWTKVKKAGIDFAIIKAGGADDGLYKDSRFEENYKNAKAVGIPVGCYYFCANDSDSASKGETMAKHFCELIAGKQFEFPVYMDIEAQKGTKAGTTACAIAFGEYMEQHGYWCGIYGSDIATFSDCLEWSKVNRFAAWVARYGGTLVHSGGIRQYSSTGKVSGISGNVDMDEATINYEPLIKAKCLNGWTEEEQPETVFSVNMPVTIKKYAKGTKVQLSENFNASEFACKHCGEIVVDLKLVAILQAIRTHFGKPVTITSPYRCATHNKAVGGATGSYHLKGRAADIIVAGVAPAEVAKYAESIGVLGIGLYSSFTHVDTRTTKSFWYSSTEEYRSTFGGSPTTPPDVSSSVPVDEKEAVEVETPTLILPTKRVTAENFATDYKEDYIGLYKTTGALYCRNGAGTGNKQLCLIPVNTVVHSYGYYTPVNSTDWLDVSVVLDNTLYTGFSSSDYLERV